MDDKAKRRLSNRSKTNNQLFAAYYDLLKVKLTPDQFQQYKRLLDLFHAFLGEFPPSEGLGLEFLAQYSTRSRATMVRYTGIIRGFMEWYGEDFNHRPRRPKKLPQWVNPDDIEKLKGCIRNKKTGKRTIKKHLMLIDFACNTGLRVGKLASLRADDIKLKEQFVIVRMGKGQKDRVIPLDDKFTDQLREYLKGMEPTNSVFGLKARSITDLISTWAQKANVKITPHSFRHFFAEQLLNRGVDINIVSKLLGHESLETTAKYLGLRPGAEREAINRLAAPEDGDYRETGELPLPGSTDRDIKPSDGREHHDAGISHRETIQRVSRTLADSVTVPSVQDSELWRKMPLEFRHDTLYLSIGQVTVSEDGEIKVSFPETGTGIEKPHLVQALLSHLGTSGEPRFAELAGQNGRLETLRMKSGHYSELLVSLYRSLLDSFEGTGTPFHDADDVQPGLTKNFFITAWVDVVLQSQGNTFIYDGWYKPPEAIPGTDLWKLKCGAYDIAVAKDTQTLATYELQHRTLRQRYLSSTLVEEINRRWRELEILVAEIKQVLIEFGDKVKLPGTCALCSETTA
ncbi:MAG TPA: tyrosine-type recombinase/integrase [Dehalococcoidia bacterium]|nr:tyrosine-type recombinase/integrase [Dehalococcoidia bacterium]